MKFHPKDYIAIVILLLLFTGKFYGFNGTLDAMIALVIGYYFAQRNSITK